jgi:hypothetical protein
MLKAKEEKDRSSRDHSDRRRASSDSDSQGPSEKTDSAEKTDSTEKAEASAEKEEAKSKPEDTTAAPVEPVAAEETETKPEAGE